MLWGDALANLCTVAFLALMLSTLFSLLPDFFKPLRALHPLTLWNHVFLTYANRLNRAGRQATTRYRRGRLMVIVSLSVLALLGLALTLFFSGIEPRLRDVLEPLLLSTFITAGSGLHAVAKLDRLLHKHSEQIPASDVSLEMMRRTAPSYDTHTLIRAGLEWLALSFAQAVVAPLLAYLLCGWPGVLVITGTKAMDRAIGVANRQWGEFSRPLAAIDSILQWLPSRFAALWLCLAAIFAPARPIQAFRTVRKQAANLISANSGWPIAAMAGALGVTLGGARAWHGALIKDEWIGAGSRRAVEADLRRGRWLYRIALLLLILSLVLLAAVGR